MPYFALALVYFTSLVLSDFSDDMDPFDPGRLELVLTVSLPVLVVLFLAVLAVRRLCKKPELLAAFYVLGITTAYVLGYQVSQMTNF